MASKTIKSAGFTMAALLALGLITATAGCTSSDGTPTSEFPATEPASAAPAPAPAPATNPSGTGETVAVKVDNTTGGTVALSNGTTVEVPAGALPAGVDTITVTSSPTAAPTDYATVSPVYVFGPDGTVFLKPLKVSLPFSAPAGTDTSTLTVLWSRSRGDGFDMVPTDFVPGPEGSMIAVAQVTHFSQGIVGKKYTVDPRPIADPYAK